MKEYIKINEMFSLFEKHFDEDYVFYGESHNFWECVYVLVGEIRTKKDDAKVFSDAVSYMNANIAEFPSIEEIARKCQISQSGLKNIFTKKQLLDILP